MIIRRTRLKPNQSAAASTIYGGLVVGTLWLAIAGRSPTIAADDPKISPSADNSKVATEFVRESARTFIGDTCTRCHNATKKTARLDLSSLAYEPEDRENFALWVRIHDRVAAGEMPPEEAKQPDPANRSAFVVSLAETCMSSEKRQMAGEGRSTQRRMNLSLIHI